MNPGTLMLVGVAAAYAWNVRLLARGSRPRRRDDVRIVVAPTSRKHDDHAAA